VELTGPPGSFAVPEGTDIRAMTGLLAPETAERTATVLVREAKAVALRHRATAEIREVEPGWDRVEVAFGRTETFVDELASYGPDVLVEAPEDLRAAVVARLRGALGVGSGAA